MSEIKGEFYLILAYTLLFIARLCNKMAKLFNFITDKFIGHGEVFINKAGKLLLKKNEELDYDDAITKFHNRQL